MFPSSAHNAYAQAALYKPGPLVLSRTFFKKSLLIDFDDFKLCELPAPTSHMQPEEEQLISHLNALADCLAGDAFWPDSLRQTAAEAQSLFERADVAEKFDFVNSNNFSTAGMGSLNDGVVPETCTSHQRNLYRTINHLLRSYWKQLGLESHNYSDFVLIADGTAVRLIPGKTIFRNGVQSAEVRAGEGEHVWTVVRCLGPDITGMPHYSIRLGNHFRSARHESLAIDLTAKHAQSVRALLIHVIEVLHMRVNFLLVAESIFFASISQVWQASNGNSLRLILIGLGICLTAVLWYPSCMLFKRSKALTTELKKIDPVYKWYMDSINAPPRVTWVLAHGLPLVFIIGWILVLVAHLVSVSWYRR